MAFPSVWPGDIDSYVPKTDGIDDVMAVDVNELQSAIVAIETMLLAAVDDGDTMYAAGATAKWTRLAHPGSSGHFWESVNNIGSGLNSVKWSAFTITGNAASSLAITSGNTSLEITSGKTLRIQAADNYTVTFPASGTVVLGTGTLYRLACWAGPNTFTTLDAGSNNQVLVGNSLGYPGWSGFLLDGTTGGKTVFAVTNTKVLTFTAANTIGVTFTGGNSTLGFGATGRVYTFPDTAGTVALLEVANTFTTDQTISLSSFGYHLALTGYSQDGTTDTYGVAFALTHNATGNRQMAFLDNATQIGVRFLVAASYIGGYNGGNSANLNIMSVLYATTGALVGVGNASPTYKLDVTGNIRCTTGFGCNGTTPQTAYASGGAVAPGAGAYGASSAANFAALATLVANIRLALVANGIMS